MHHTHNTTPTHVWAIELIKLIDSVWKLFRTENLNMRQINLRLNFESMVRLCNGLTWNWVLKLWLRVRLIFCKSNLNFIHYDTKPHEGSPSSGSWWWWRSTEVTSNPLSPGTGHQIFVWCSVSVGSGSEGSSQPLCWHQDQQKDPNWALSPSCLGK